MNLSRDELSEVVDLITHTFITNPKRENIFALAFPNNQQLMGLFEFAQSPQQFAIQVITTLHNNHRADLITLLETIQRVEGGDLAVKLQPYIDKLKRPDPLPTPEPHTDDRPAPLSAHRTMIPIGGVAMVLIGVVVGIMLIMATGQAPTPPPTPSITAPPSPTTLISAGCFQMGPTEPLTRDQRPIHEVCITKPFRLSTYEITNADYQAFIDAGGYTTQAYWSADGWARLKAVSISGPRNFPGFGDPQQPRIGVSWYEADAYARWAGGRLPTEAEWEYAARGGNGFTYPWGDGYTLHAANIDESGVGGTDSSRTRNVGAHTLGKSGRFGLFDMAGNAAEWVQDFFGATYYGSSPKDDPQGPITGNLRVFRGGSWRDDTNKARTTYRQSLAAGERTDSIGFRVAFPAR